MSKWGKWVGIENNATYKGSGVYKIAIFNSNESPVDIPRFLDKDREGILQIGGSKNIGRRMRNFRGAMAGKKYPHEEGKRLGLIMKSAKFQNLYKSCRIRYCFKKLLNKSEAQKEEKRLLEDYFEKYGEFPPLNRRFP